MPSANTEVSVTTKSLPELKTNRSGLCRESYPTGRSLERKRYALEPDKTVIEEASNGREAMILVQRLSPHSVLMDVENRR